MATAVKEKPINLRADQVRAVLDGRKTQMRRAIREQNKLATVVGRNATGELDNDVPRPMPDWQKESLLEKCPYGQPGDRLWVRETVGYGWHDGIDGYSALCPTGHDRKKPDKVFYKADFPVDDWKNGKRCWRPSIHMPRWASRLTLEILSVRVEQLNEISGDDCLAGIEPPTPNCGTRSTARALGKAISWAWVIEFRPLTKEPQ